MNMSTYLQLDLAKNMINGVAKSVNHNFIKIITNNDPEEVSNIIYRTKMV